MAIRIAVVGVGKIARDQHLPAIAGSDLFTLVAGVSHAGMAPDVPNFRELAELAASGIGVDAVALCTPPLGRAGLAAQALHHGWHVLMEKPPGATVAELAGLPEAAAAAERSLLASWHSRFAPGVSPAAAWLRDRRITAVTVRWHEDIRQWHPGQDWLLAAGGLGVFDPGINALSILTAILPGRLAVRSARLVVPDGRQGPIAAALRLGLDRADNSAATADVAMDLDFRHQGPPVWDIVVTTDTGILTLADGGHRLLPELAQPAPETGEYPSLYRHFADLIEQRRSDCDLRPLQLVADAFLVGERLPAPPFTW